MTSPSDTPETDLAWAEYPFAGPAVSVHLARKLERQRDASCDLCNRAFFLLSSYYLSGNRDVEDWLDIEDWLSDWEELQKQINLGEQE